MLSPELEETLQKALLLAADKGHEYATLEQKKELLSDKVFPVFFGEIEP